MNLSALSISRLRNANASDIRMFLPMYKRIFSELRGEPIDNRKIENRAINQGNRELGAASSRLFQDKGLPRFLLGYHIGLRKHTDHFG